MKPVKSKKAAVVLAGVLVASLAACAQNENSTDPTANPSGNTNKLSGTIDGAGASSQTAAQEAWRAGFASLQPDVIVNYDPQGSGVGREQFAAGGIAFAGSDRAFKVDEIGAGLQACSANSGVVEVPVYIGPIVVAFNLDEADSLNLAPTVIADIFTGKITKWNDPAIAADNPGVSLPDLPITPVHRSDKSGTTGNFTEYLEATAGDAWPHESGEEWPIASGEAAEKTQGVVATVTATKGAVGYVDAGQAGGLGWASIKVGANWVKSSPEGAAAAVAASAQQTGRSAGDVVYDLDRTTQAAGAYPLVQISYLVACEKYDDADIAEMVAAYFAYVTSEAGQKAAATNAGSAPITADGDLSAKVNAAVALISS